ncbi:hypothetical protein [Streptomyces sp. NPDC052701]|uniref:hypothetical protein n=1 Tax=Streptomyces sp. NPDC052701 TaxID=3155533 RepID=UPI0034359775
MAMTVTERRHVMGGVMKLGKALATGVAQEQEQPQAHEEEPGIPAEDRRTEAAAPEEAPVPR